VRIVALHGAVPLLNPDGHSPNVVRSPTQLQTVYGDLGTLVTGTPTSADFAEAVWVSTKQNGIYQTWSPLYTMFSRGNIKEKARLLALPSLSRQALGERGCTAVDLYAGIGYFTFSYAKAEGVRNVLCWEINPWSVEALARGAAENKWTVEVCRGSVSGETRDGLLGSSDAKIVVLQEDNAHALRRVVPARRHLPPIRHVNCGLLPTSEPVWADAVRLLDPLLGGWIHAHENIAGKDETARVEQVTQMMQAFAGQDRHVHCEHVERVKSYSPGVMHCVLDFYISGTSSEPSRPDR
jgi:tRNA wybutosine-synthesizing protein 2